MQRPRTDTVAVTALFLTAVGLLVVSVATGLVRPLASTTTTCGATITVTRSNVSGHLTVSSATVPVGRCVTFANPTTAAVSLVVRHDGSTVCSGTVPAGATGASGTTYTPRSTGPHSLTASSVTAPGTTSTGAATLYVAAAPSSSPSATGGSSAPAGHGAHQRRHRRHHRQAHHHHSGGKSGAARGNGVGGAAGSNGGGLPTGLVTPSLPGSPGVSPRQPPESDPVVAPQPTTPVVVPTTSAHAATLLSGPIEPAEDNSRGLPTAVAVVVLIGLALGWGRVVLSASAPVDRRPRGDHRL